MQFNLLFTPDVIVSILAAFFVLFMGFFVLISDIRLRVNRSFFYLTCSVVVWIIFVLLHFYSVRIDDIVISARGAFAGAGLIMLFLFFFTYLFPVQNQYRVPIVMTTIFGLASSALFFSSLTIKNIELTGSNRIFIYGWGYYFFMAYFTAFLILSAYNLFSKYKSSQDVYKTQIQYVSAGLLISISFGFITNVFIPFLTGENSIARYGPAAASIFIFLATIAILKHHLFNLKIIATESFTFLLWTTILVRILTSETVSDVVINSLLLILLIVIGIFLIRSVIREVEQRERIEKLATELEKANEHLTELNREKSEFVSFANHQLRAPLAAMKGYASLILEGDMGKIPEEARQGVSRIFDSTNTLVSIVDDYLNVSRIELGSMKYAFDTIDLKHLVEDVVGELKPNIDKTKLAFSFTAENNGTDYRMTADRDKLKQVITNLIDNSLKYTPSGSVTVSLSLDKIKHRFILMIKDTGIGIAPETLPHLFAKWSRAGNANKTNIKGTGLGLYVAKEIVASHKGDIRAESPGEGKGSTFIVEFDPLVKA